MTIYHETMTAEDLGPGANDQVVARYAAWLERRILAEFPDADVLIRAVDLAKPTILYETDADLEEQQWIAERFDEWLHYRNAVARQASRARYDTTATGQCYSDAEGDL
jgi:hypothetical protein